jgi:hypothetical protein
MDQQSLLACLVNRMTDGANRAPLPQSRANRHRIAVNKQQMPNMLSLVSCKGRTIDERDSWA